MARTKKSATPQRRSESSGRGRPGPKPSEQPDASPYRQRFSRLLREATLFVAAACTLFLLASLISHDPTDPGWAGLGVDGSISNIFGRPGAWFADVLLGLFGYLGYVFPWLVLYGGWLAYVGGRFPSSDAFSVGVRGASLTLWLVAGCGLMTLAIPAAEGFSQGSGGILGAVTLNGLGTVLNPAGSAWLLITVFVITLSMGWGFSWLVVTERVGAWVLLASRATMRWSSAQLAGLQGWRERRRKARAQAPRIRSKAPDAQSRARREPVMKNGNGRGKGKAASGTQLPLPIDADEQDLQVPKFDPDKDDPLPPSSLLDAPRQGGAQRDKGELERMSGDLEQHLANFGVQAKVMAVEPGPVITRFELEPAPGVKVSQFTNLAKDLARAMSTARVRVVEVIPGKSVVGLEIPNEQRELVGLRHVLESPRYRNASSPLTMALGKDIGGVPQVADLQKMPHLLVAGTTGSGKSVAVNVMILSMLYKATAEQVRFIMIDPKMLELSVYADIPHLLAPVVTDMKEAANALRWCVAEMERRYKLMSELGVRNVAGFNRKIKEAAARGTPIKDPIAAAAQSNDEDGEIPELETLPAIVVIVDELSDLMMVVGKKVEELIARLAQKARAAGLHMILATQRPSVDVITGLIKANIPTRIAFQVASRVDSRTILDQQGAENLLGNGDMLYLPPGTGFPMRVHGAFVDDHEVHRVVEYLKQVGTPDYRDEIVSGIPEGAETPGGGGESEGEADPLYDQAVAVVTESRKASISYVQRRLRVGYNRAARLVEEMEAAGVVSPTSGSGGREVLAPPPPE